MRFRIAATSMVMAALFSLSQSVSGQESGVDPGLPEYTNVQGVSGEIKSVGSDSMNNLMNKWLENFVKRYPNVKHGVEGKGSGTAMPALNNGQSTFGPMSRDVEPKESTAFEEKFGYKPTVIAVSLDMLSVFVNKDNKIKSLSMQEVDAIFSKTRKQGLDADITKWGQVGLEGEFADAPIALHGRNATSGTYTFFKDHVLKKGDYKDTVAAAGGSSDVVRSVGNDKFAIGYSGFGYKTADVRAVPLSEKKGGAVIEAVPENAYSSKYPLSRYLYIAVNKDPTKELDPLRKEFLRFVLSREGQEIVKEEGYLPLKAKAAAEQAKKIGVTFAVTSDGAANKGVVKKTVEKVKDGAEKVKQGAVEKAKDAAEKTKDTADKVKGAATKLKEAVKK